jgi:hypothetical protein
MNHEDNHFEERLQGIAPRPIPSSWRQEILRHARNASHVPIAPTPTPSVTTLRTFFTQLLWPHPKAWGALAAAWMLILGLNFASREPAPSVLASEPEAVSPQLRQLLHQQQQLFAELVGIEPPPPAVRPKSLPGQPRSQRREQFGYA